MIFSIFTLWNLLDIKQKNKLNVILFFQFLSSIFEILGIGSLIPVINVAVNNPNQSDFLTRSLSEAYKYSFINLSYSNFIIFSFCFLVLIGCLIRLYSNWITARYIYSIGSYIAEEVYKNILKQKYEFYLSKDNGELIDTIAVRSASIVDQTLMPVIVIINATILTICIIVFIFYINFTLALNILIFGFVTYGLTTYFFKNRSAKEGEKYRKASSMVFGSVSENLLSIRQVILDNLENYYIFKFKKYDQELKLAQSRMHYMANSPKFIIEACGLIFIAYLLNQFVIGSDNNLNLAIIGALVFSVQKLIPLLHQTYHSLSTINAGTSSLELILRYMNGRMVDLEALKSHYCNNLVELKFKHQIEFNDVSFKYEGSESYIISNLNLTVPIGSRVGIIGKSGVGKSTFIDLLTGLLQPVTGSIKIDGIQLQHQNIKKWQEKIGYVDQSPILVSGTIKDNVSMGSHFKDFNELAFEDASRDAGLDEIADKFYEKFDAQIGERGGMLSGGERQRVCIARALYKNADILVLDEFTSALDKNMHNQVMKSVINSNMDKTIFLISHDMSILENVNIVLEILGSGHYKITII